MCSLYLRKRSGVRFVALLMALSLSVPAIAAETEVTPSLGLRQEYTDNLFYTSSNRRETFITRISPGIKAAARTELLSGSLDVKSSALLYSANSSMNEVDQVYEGNGSYRLTPLLAVYGSAAYRRESWPDREIEISGETLNTTSKRQVYGGHAEYRISELTAVFLNYGYNQFKYDDQSRYSDVATHNISAGVEYNAGRLIQLFKLRSTARYTRSDYDMAQVDSYELTAGGSGRIHELWSVSADVGGHFTRSGFSFPAFDPVTGFGTRHDTSNTSGWVLMSSLDYGGETLKGNLAYNHNVSNSTGRFGEAVERDIVNASLSKKISYELFASLGAGYYRSKADSKQFGSQKVDETSLRSSFSLRYDFNRSMAAELGYDYFYVENAISGTNAFRNKVFFQLTARTSFFE